MSLARLCDCTCHDDDLRAIDEFEQWATFAGKDICQWCLEGRGCRRWTPHVPPERSELERQVHAAYEKAIADHLRGQPLFADLFKKEPPATTTGGS